MVEAFKNYAEYYDLIYKDKNYERECDFVEEIFKKYSQKSIKELLDAGCGTGGHAFPLAERGYEIVAFDQSKLMVTRAREKARERKTNVEFHVADLRDLSLNKKFDACISLFAVMGYLTKNSDIQKALRNIKGHLQKDALFVFDVWNGLAVLRILPSVRVKIMRDKNRKVIRTAEPELDSFNHLCKVHYRIISLQDEVVVGEVEEIHLMRFYFPQEIKYYLESANFEVLTICPFLNLNGKVDEEVWNMAIVARAG